MGSQLTTLTSADVQRFERDGYVVVRQAFSRADGLAMERQWWRELEHTRGMRRDDRASWRQIAGDLKGAKRDRIQATILTQRVRGTFDDLLGPGAWSPPRDWGRCLVTFPEPGAWDVPARRWHWDNPCEPHSDRPRALFVVSFIGPVAPRGGGTLILSGSPRLLIQQERRMPADRRRGLGTGRWDELHRCHPWLMALTGQAPSPADRIAAFMAGETTVDGVPLRVVELTGEPGDMVFCHPAMIHCVAPNRGTRPRFMRIRTQVLTHEGRELHRRLPGAATLLPARGRGDALRPGMSPGGGLMAPWTRG
jgi:Phytanoyl-CoA dioxygenase (PhyH)